MRHVKQIGTYWGVLCPNTSRFAERSINKTKWGALCPISSALSLAG
ncbi:MAG: hypothetical protein LBT59_00320, partial [Clostridiales bacterium]|nr:hypothetical protein [Clostridiales bacterium]